MSKKGNFEIFPKPHHTNTPESEQRIESTQHSELQPTVPWVYLLFTIYDSWCKWIGDCVLIKTTHLTLKKIISSVLTLFICNKGSQKLIFLLKTPHVFSYCAACVCPAQPIKLKWLAFFTKSVVSLSRGAAYEQTNQHSGFFVITILMLSCVGKTCNTMNFPRSDDAIIILIENRSYHPCITIIQCYEPVQLVERNRLVPVVKIVIQFNEKATMSIIMYFRLSLYNWSVCSCILRQSIAVALFMLQNKHNLTPPTCWTES